MGEGITYPPNLPAHVERLLRIVDGISIWTGKLCAWLIIPLMATLVYEVISRYFFSSPTLWAFDTTYMIYGAHFMLVAAFALARHDHIRTDRSEEHTSELQSLMRISYAVFCLK